MKKTQTLDRVYSTRYRIAYGVATLFLLYWLPACNPKPIDNQTDSGTALAVSSTSEPIQLSPTTTATAIPTTSIDQPTHTPTPSQTPTQQPSLTSTESSIPTSVAGKIAAEASFDEGLNLFQAGGYEDAAVEFENAIQLFPWSTDAYWGLHYAQIIIAHNELLARMDQQIKESDESILRNPKDADAYFLRGQAKYLRILTSGEPAAEEDVYTPADNVNIQGTMPVYHHLILTTAIEDLDQAIRLTLIMPWLTTYAD